MRRDMSENEMLNSFLFVVSKSRVIAWKAIGSGVYNYSLGELRNFLGREKVEVWLRHCIAFDTLEQATEFAYGFAHGLIPPLIDIDAILENGIRSIEEECRQLNTHFSWTYNDHDRSGQWSLLDPPPTPPRPIELTSVERLVDVTNRRTELRDKWERLTGEAREKRKTLRADAEKAQG